MSWNLLRGYNYLRHPINALHDMRKLITAITLTLSVAAYAQNYNDLVEIVRSDIRTGKQALVLENMALNEEQSAKLNPIYAEYSDAMRVHWDKRIALIKEYAAAYNTLTDEQAAGFLKRSDALEKEAITIRTTYEKKMMKVLPASLVARWVQVERIIGHVINLQVSAEIPLAR